MLVVKNDLPMQKTREMQVQSLGWEDPLEKGIAPHSSILAWRIPWTEEPGRLRSIGLQQVRHDCGSTHTCKVNVICDLVKGGWVQSSMHFGRDVLLVMRNRHYC